MIIYGFKEGKWDNLGPTLPVTCPKCHRNLLWDLYQSRKWFTLYYIPVIPYENNLALICGNCGINIRLDQKEGKKALHLNKMAKSFVDGNGSKGELMAVVEESGLLPRALAAVPKDVNLDIGAKWNSLNDKLVEAIELSNYRPKNATDQI